MVSDLFQQAIQDAVDEPGAVFVAIAFRKHDRFVHGDPARSIGEEDLVGSETQHIAIGHGHSRQRPVSGQGCQLAIDLGSILQRTAEQPVSEFGQRFAALGAGSE